MTETKTVMGRPKTAINIKRVQVTISQDDFDLLESLADFTCSRPATMMRELLNDSRPVLLSMLEALEANKKGTTPPAGSLADKMLKMAVKGSNPSQIDIAELLEPKK